MFVILLNLGLSALNAVFWCMLYPQGTWNACTCGFCLGLAFSWMLRLAFGRARH